MKRRTATKLIFGMVITAMGVFGADSSLGTWKWNAVKSKSTTSNPIKSRTDVYTATPDGAIKVTRTETRSDGTTYNGSFTFRYDGKDYPVTGLQFDSMSAKRIDANTTTSVTKKIGGVYNQTTQTVYSADGKIKTSSTKGTDTQGKPVKSTYVYDKQ